MDTCLKVVFADGEAFALNGYSIQEDLVSLHYREPAENQSGFTIYNEAGNVVAECLDFVYRWDVVDQKKGTIYYTNNKDYRQTAPWPDISGIQEYMEPLSNEELTEAVADLMYEVSVVQLGL